MSVICEKPKGIPVLMQARNMLQCVAVWCCSVMLQCDVAVSITGEESKGIPASMQLLDVLQCAAMYCNVLQCVAVCCSELLAGSRVAVYYLQGVARHPRVHARIKCVAVCCSVLQCVAVCCSVLQCVAVRCSVYHLRGVERYSHVNATITSNSRECTTKALRTCPPPTTPAVQCTWFRCFNLEWMGHHKRMRESP